MWFPTILSTLLHVGACSRRVYNIWCGVSCKSTWSSGGCVTHTNIAGYIGLQGVLRGLVDRNVVVGSQWVGICRQCRFVAGRWRVGAGRQAAGRGEWSLVHYIFHCVELWPEVHIKLFGCPLQRIVSQEHNFFDSCVATCIYMASGNNTMYTKILWTRCKSNMKWGSKYVECCVHPGLTTSPPVMSVLL